MLAERIKAVVPRNVKVMTTISDAEVVRVWNLVDPEGVGHVMEIGTYIGRNWGKVTQVTNGEVVVTEEYQTIDGELVVNNISMTLPTVDDGSVR